tara:strand:- start:99 stop:458 length:360 start_codon:yes stop_codon:yes gene_type:complete
MFAIVDIAGFQEKVSEGEKIRVPLLGEEAGKKVTFKNVFLVSKSDSDVKIGTPYVSGATVEAKVLEHGKSKKIRVFKMKRRKRYRRVKGHRQDFSDIEIVSIKVGAAAAKKEVDAGENK